MEIRQAILKAADHIEATPNDFDFSASGIPHACGTPGCALGWIGHFLGLADKNAWHVSYTKASGALGVGHYEFYTRMTEVEGGGPNWEVGQWPLNAPACARTLRLYADKYHPAESRALIPASVMRIFTMTQDEIRAEFQRAESSV